jgi:hypothetical protein
MIEMFEKDKTLEFELTKPEYEGKVAMKKHKDFDNPVVVWTEGNCIGDAFVLNTFTFGYNCEIVTKPVTFVEAINSGKQIKYKDWNFYCSLTSTMNLLASKVPSTVKDMINGKWYIEP